MTVSYTAEVATCKGFGCFLKLLFRWRGSIYKLVWPDLFLFLGTYFSLSILYRLFLNKEQQLVFEQIARYCEKYGNLIPISFVLGFYVSIVVGRWWSQYQAIPWPDSTAVFVSANIHGQDEKSRIMRRTIMRYCCLASTMCFTLISPRVKKRFPTLDHFVEAGLMLDNEKQIIHDLNQKHSHPKHWLPIVWACSIVTRARKEGKIRDDFAVKTILDELNKFRSSMGTLTQYDWISVPLVYTQVVTLAVYSFFLACVMGRQWIKPDCDPTSSKTCNAEIDLVFPIFTTLQFFFYMGWLKVAESLVNPFGNDDDDFELNWMIDRNLQVSYLIVDEMHHEHPELLKDQYWDTVLPQELPHTVASEQYREEAPTHSTANVKVSYEEGEIISPPSVRSIHQLSESGEPGRRVSMTSKFGSSILRRGRTGSVRSTASQSTLAESVSSKLSRAGSITSVFRRMFSRDRDRTGVSGDLHSPTEGGGVMSWAGSNLAVQNRNVLEDVIPELDENLTTIVSMRGEREKKPTVHDVFGTSATQQQQLQGAAVSAPIDIPKPSNDGEYPQPNHPGGMMTSDPSSKMVPVVERPKLLSMSAPSGAKGKFELRSVTPETPIKQDPPMLEEEDEEDLSTAETITVASSVHASPDEEVEASSELEETGGGGTTGPHQPLMESSSPDANDSMDDIQLRKQQSSSRDNLAKKLAKTFGMKDKSSNDYGEGGDDDREAEVHLLSDMNTSKDSSDDTSSSQQQQKEPPQK